MLSTRLTEVLGITHPVVLAGMARHTNADLVAAVTNAGGFGMLGVTEFPVDEQRSAIARIRDLTKGPFGLNHSLAFVNDEWFSASVAEGPHVISTSWAKGDQDLRPYFDAAHGAGILVMHMVDTLDEAVRTAEAGADIVVAQGTDGGGHVGTIGTMTLVPQVVRAVAPIPVVAAGGIADGHGLAAALALGAEGVLMGSRLLATPESPVPAGYKRALVESASDEAFLTEIPDIADGMVWPGATARVRRNEVIKRWLGRESEVRRHWERLGREMRLALQRDDAEEYPIQMGQTVGLIDSVIPAGQIIRDIVDEAEQVLRAITTPTRLQVADEAPSLAAKT